MVVQTERDHRAVREAYRVTLDVTAETAPSAPSGRDAIALGGPHFRTIAQQKEAVALREIPTPALAEGTPVGTLVCQLPSCPVWPCPWVRERRVRKEAVCVAPCSRLRGEQCRAHLGGQAHKGCYGGSRAVGAGVCISFSPLTPWEMGGQASEHPSFMLCFSVTKTPSVASSHVLCSRQLALESGCVGSPARLTATASSCVIQADAETGASTRHHPPMSAVKWPGAFR